MLYDCSLETYFQSVCHKLCDFQILASLPAASSQESGLGPQQELFFKQRIDEAGVQFINLGKPYEDQVSYFILLRSETG